MLSLVTGCPVRSDIVCTQIVYSGSQEVPNNNNVIATTYASECRVKGSRDQLKLQKMAYTIGTYEQEGTIGHILLPVSEFDMNIKSVLLCTIKTREQSCRSEREIQEFQTHFHEIKNMSRSRQSWESLNWFILHPTKYSKTLYPNFCVVSSFKKRGSCRECFSYRVSRTGGRAKSRSIAWGLLMKQSIVQCGPFIYAVYPFVSAGMLTIAGM